MPGVFAGMATVGAPVAVPGVADFGRVLTALADPVPTVGLAVSTAPRQPRSPQLPMTAAAPALFRFATADAAQAAPAILLPGRGGPVLLDVHVDIEVALTVSGSNVAPAAVETCNPAPAATPPRVLDATPAADLPSRAPGKASPAIVPSRAVNSEPLAADWRPATGPSPEPSPRAAPVAASAIAHVLLDALATAVPRARQSVSDAEAVVARPAASAVDPGSLSDVGVEQAVDLAGAASLPARASDPAAVPPKPAPTGGNAPPIERRDDMRPPIEGARPLPALSGNIVAPFVDVPARRPAVIGELSGCEPGVAMPDRQIATLGGPTAQRSEAVNTSAGVGATVDAVTPAATTVRPATFVVADLQADVMPKPAAAVPAPSITPRRKGAAPLVEAETPILLRADVAPLPPGTVLTPLVMVAPIKVSGAPLLPEEPDATPRTMMVALSAPAKPVSGEGAGLPTPASNLATAGRMPPPIAPVYAASDGALPEKPDLPQTTGDVAPPLAATSQRPAAMRPARGSARPEPSPALAPPSRGVDRPAAREPGPVDSSPVAPAAAKAETLQAPDRPPHKDVPPSAQPIASFTPLAGKAAPEVPVAAPAIPMPYRAAQLAHDAGVVIAHRLADGAREVTIRMEPAEFGRIDVRMSFDDNGKLRATVGADSPVVLDLLRRDIGHLVGAMSDAGVSSDQRSFRFEAQGDTGQNQRPASGGGDQPHERRQAPDRSPFANYPDDDRDPATSQPLRWTGQIDVKA